ncbi:glucose-6-phosphate dehydrogenase [Paraphysoderma sedebokerense]|nr:glucose-6-phosphate dehydrogenase [Paraphysoderma sedebokerense]
MSAHDSSTPTSPTIDSKEYMTIVVLGASGDLAKKKTYPALFSLYKHHFLPSGTQIIGYARSHLSRQDFHSRISSHIKTSSDADKSLLNSFLSICHYMDGQYDSAADFQKLNSAIREYENKDEMGNGRDKKNRIFYMALPPSVFIPVAKNVKEQCYATEGWNRLIVEKPFGKDLQSSRELGTALSALWTEKEVYRIDHYLGKEMVKNLFIIRFANVFFSSVWNRDCIENIQITFKEKIGTEGRGGYFDEFGIIRDVMQNHLLQILSIIAMERPVSISAEDIRDEKVKVLRQIPPIKLNEMILGQYTASTTDKAKSKGYLDDDTVPTGSLTPTYAAAVLHIRNDRWEGVPFIMKCGKAVNEQKAEIRIQFKDVPGTLFPNPLSRNELVIRVQPNESVYLKLMNKHPGHSYTPIISELDLSYNERYTHIRIPDAYESLILDVLRGDQANFVRDDELDAAWKIFTPVLDEIEQKKVKPEGYEYGSRGPESLEGYLKKWGVVRDRQEYVWKKDEKSKM